MNTEFHDDEVGQESAAEVIEVTGLEDAITDIPETGEEQPPELQPTSALSQSFKLLNVYLVDSLSRGRIQEMAIDGGTVLTGKNGQGKTSLLSAILLFFGVEPTSLVSRGKDSFVNYYLPRSTSYLAYEYQRGDGERRMVVAYSNSTGDKVHFRLVRTGFDRSMFLTEDKKLVVNRDFRRRLVELKVQHAERQIETYQDYRCIMQFWQQPGDDKVSKRRLKELSADYAITPYRASGSLRHLEKLIKGMFSREANFDDLKALVADWVFEGTTSKGIKTDKDKVANWPRDYRAYMRVMSFEGNLEGAHELFLAHQGAREELSAIKEKFIFVREHLEALIRNLRNEEQGLKDTYTDELNKHGESVTELLSKIATLRSSIERLSSQINDVETKKAYYEQIGISRMLDKHAQLHAKETDLRHDQEELDALEGEVTNITSRFDKLINTIDKDLVRFREVASLDQEREHEAVRSKLRDVELEFDAKIEDVENEAKDERQVLSKKLSNLQNQKGAAEHQVAHPVVRQELVQAVEEKSDELNEARRLLGEAQGKVDKLNLAIQKLDAAIERENTVLENHDRQIKEQEAEIQRVIKANTPEPDTLLHFLRESVPDWSNNIARVINPAILQRNDLDPNLVSGDAKNIYGLAINLAELDPVCEADETALQELLLNEEAKLELLRRARQMSAERRQALGLEREALQSELSEAKRGSLNATSSVQQLEEEFKGVKKAFEREKSDALSIAQAKLEEVTAQTSQADAALEDFERKTAARIADLKTQGNAKKQFIERDSQIKISNIKNTVSQQKIAADKRIKELQAAMSDELLAAGADANKIHALREKCKASSEEIRTIQGYLEKITEWRIWRDDQFTKYDSYKQQYETEEERLSAKNTELNELKGTWEVRKAQLDQATKVNGERRVAAEGEQSIAAYCLDTELQDVDATHRHSRYDESWVAKLLKKQMSDKKLELKNTLNELDHQLDRMKSAFIAVPNSQPADYYTDSFRRLSDEEKVDPKCRLDLFSAYFKSRHEEDRRILISGAHVIFGDIDELYTTLRRFSERISRFNSELQQHLTHGSHVFKSITNLNMQLYSSVEELQYWKVIGKISESRAYWVSKDQLPDEDFVANLESLLGTWDLNQGIHAEFKSLVGLKGSVEERGTLRHFRTKQDLVNISSNGLSYLILIILFLGFISKIRGSAPVQIAWALDELKNLDSANIYSLCRYLNDNEITLCTAFPDPDAETLQLFKNQYTVDDQRRLKTCEIVAEDDLESLAMGELQ